MKEGRNIYLKIQKKGRSKERNKERKKERETNRERKIKMMEIKKKSRK